jgi:pimeloyl-ACP methyl ester carboxylesterase
VKNENEAVFFKDGIYVAQISFSHRSKPIYGSARENIVKILIPFFIFFTVVEASALAKSMNLKSLSNKYSSRHFKEIQLPSGMTHYQSVGEGPVVIVVHGTNGPMSVYDKNVGALVEAGFRVIRYDLYGRGFSARIDESPYSLETYETQLEELIEALNLGPRLRLVGNSLGTIITTEYALHHPSNIESLLLIGPAGFPITKPPGAWLQDIPVLGKIFTYFMAYDKILEQNDHYFVSGKVPEDLRPFIVDSLTVPGTTDAILKTLKNAPLQSYQESYRELGKTKIPVGVIWGRKDATFPYENSTALLEEVPQAGLMTIENAGHVPQYERDEEVTPLLVNFEKSFN